jgi:hypothetical protein
VSSAIRDESFFIASKGLVIGQLLGRERPYVGHRHGAEAVGDFTVGAPDFTADILYGDACHHAAIELHRSAVLVVFVGRLDFNDLDVIEGRPAQIAGNAAAHTAKDFTTWRLLHIICCIGVAFREAIPTKNAMTLLPIAQL